MYPCNKCAGTGLFGFYELKNGGYSWNGEYCEHCEGVGYYKIKILDESIYECYNCNLSGSKSGYTSCVICDGNGVIDWITHARGKTK